jgi:sporulation protein YlmC with PRC-barrel domain
VSNKLISDEEGPVTETVPGRRYDAVSHLLDRQLVDPDGKLVAKVDELELADLGDGRLTLTAVLTGPGALGPRLGGRIGQLVVAVWRRLHPAQRPEPGRIPFRHVVRVDSAVHLSMHRHELAVDGFEVWVREHVVSRIPGARHDPE